MTDNEADREILAELRDFLRRVSSAQKQLFVALDLDEREPLPDEQGIPQSQVNRLLADLRPLDADSAIGQAYKRARAAVPDRDVPLIDEIYKRFWQVVENAMRGESNANDNHRFLHSLTMRPPASQLATTDASSSSERVPPATATEPKPFMTKDEAYVAARRLAREDPEFKKLTIHDMAERIGCSPTTLRHTEFWEQLLKEQPKRRRSKSRHRSKGRRSKKMNFTAAAGVAQETEPDPLYKLIAEEEQAAIDHVLASSMDESGQAATIKKLRDGEMSPQQATEAAQMFPPANHQSKRL